MNELTLYLSLYLITLLFFLWAKSPKKIQFICPNCDKLQKAYLDNACSCGKTLRWTDRVSDAVVLLKNLEKQNVIKIIKAKGVHNDVK